MLRDWRKNKLFTFKRDSIAGGLPDREFLVLLGEGACGELLRRSEFTGKKKKLEI